MTQTSVEVVEDRLHNARQTLNDLISRRRSLEAELDAIVSERDDTHFAALIGTDHETLRRLIALNDKIADLRAENAGLRASITATIAELDG